MTGSCSRFGTAGRGVSSTFEGVTPLLEAVTKTLLSPLKLLEPELKVLEGPVEGAVAVGSAPTGAAPTGALEGPPSTFEPPLGVLEIEVIVLEAPIGTELGPTRTLELVVAGTFFFFLSWAKVGPTTVRATSKRVAIFFILTIIRWDRGAA